MAFSGRTRAGRRIKASLPAFVAAVGLAVSACAVANPVGRNATANPAAAPSDGPGSSAQFPAPSKAATVAPLTGLPAPGGRTAGRPAVALALAGAQVRGLSSADVVFQEMTPAVRYIAVYQSRNARAAGPVTTTQPADTQILSVLHAVVGYAGGTTGFIRTLDHGTITDMGLAGHGSLYQDGAGRLTAATAPFDRAPGASAPPQIFAYRGSGLGTGHQLASTGTWRASSVTVTMPGAVPQKWMFRAAADRWEQVSGGPRVLVADLVIQTVAYKRISTSRRLGTSVLSARVLGSGKAMVLTGLAGTAARGSRGLGANATWAKPNLKDVTNYLDAKGFQMDFAPGPTWVLLAPRGTKIAVGRTQ